MIIDVCLVVLVVMFNLWLDCYIDVLWLLVDWFIVLCDFVCYGEVGCVVLVWVLL